MITYITAFIFYTCAIIGVLFAAFVIYKKTMMTTNINKSPNMQILDSITIGPKKNLLVVKVLNRKFLIASGLEHTTFLADLTNETDIDKIKENIDNLKDNAFFKGSDAPESKGSTYELLKPKNKLFEDDFDELDQANDVITIRDEKIAPRREMLRRLLKNLNSTESYRPRSRR